MPVRIIVTLSCVVILNATTARSDDNWPRFRGPNGSGIGTAVGLPATWSDDDYAWTVDLPGAGHSSPVVWGERAFVTSADDENRRRILQCLDCRTGRELWKKEFPFTKHKTHKNNSLASNTPAVDADYVYVLMQARDTSPLMALDHDGNLVWQYNLGPYLHGQGPGTSPIVHENMVIVCNDHSKGSFLLAVDRRTGQELWKVPREGKRACYATPCVLDVAGRPAEIVFSHCFEGITGVDPETGRYNWMIDVFGDHSQRAVGSPVVVDDIVIANSGARAGDKNTVAVRPSGSGADSSVAEAYRFTKSSSPHVPSPLVVDGLLFLWSDSGIVTCADAKTGKKIWQQRVGGNYFGSPVAADGKVFCISVDGDVVVIAAADEYRLLGRTSLGEASHSTPAIGDGRLILRTKSKMFCVASLDNQ